MWREAYPGRYAIDRTPVCALSVLPPDLEFAEREVGDTECASVSTQPSHGVSVANRSDR
jgi:hypothetical protein